MKFEDYLKEKERKRRDEGEQIVLKKKKLLRVGGEGRLSFTPVI